LLAHERYKVVPFAVVIVAGYLVTLFALSDRFLQMPQPMQAFLMVVKLLGVFSFGLFAVCSWFTWGPSRR
jgi:hypothetical protein